jgi:hypothetical protein
LTTLPPGGGITSVACLSDTFCIAAGGGANQADAAQTTGDGQTQSWDGVSWATPETYYPAPTGAGPWPVLPAVTCTAGPFCVLVDGSGFVSNGDGTNWITPVAVPSAPALPDNPADPGAGHPGSRTAAVSCTSRTFCAIVDNTGTVDTWRDGSWLTPQSFGTPTGPGGATAALYAQGRVGVSCPDESSCTAVVGTTVLDWDGTQWSEEPNPWILATDSHGVAVSCSTPTLCAVVSGPYLSFRNGTGAWSTPRIVDAGGSLTAVSCPVPSYCVASDAGGSVITFDGTSWSAPVRVLPEPSEYGALGTSLDCTMAQFCMVISGDGDYTTHDPSGPAPTVPATAPSTTSTATAPSTTSTAAAGSPGG